MVKIIAECGVNHGGEISNAFRYIDAAKQCGADAIKFQTWLPGEITGAFTSKCNYMEFDDGTRLSRYEISEKLRLDHNDFIRLKNYSDSIGIEFMSTPDGHDSLDFLLENHLLKTIKVGSTEIVNIPFLSRISSTSLPVILSTGTADMAEVASAVQVFSGRPHDVTLLQCTSAYPCPDDEVNLQVIPLFRSTFGIDVGFSDHSLGSCAAIAAVALGATVIEKHIYLDSDLWTPDKDASMGITEFTSLCSDIRRLSTMISSNPKHRTLSESKNLSSIRRGLCASRNLSKGDILVSSDFDYKRPYHGLDSTHIPLLVGRKLLVSKEIDEPIQLSDFV